MCSAHKLTDGRSSERLLPAEYLLHLNNQNPDSLLPNISLTPFCFYSTKATAFTISLYRRKQLYFFLSAIFDVTLSVTLWRLPDRAHCISVYSVYTDSSYSNSTRTKFHSFLPQSDHCSIESALTTTISLGLPGLKCIRALSAHSAAEFNSSPGR
jgi:hypothetical protein